MYTLEELNESQMLLTTIVYQAHQSDKTCPAQYAYQYLSWMKDISLGRARQETNKMETYENGWRLLTDIITDYAEKTPSFTEKDFVLWKLDDFANAAANVFLERYPAIS